MAEWKLVKAPPEKTYLQASAFVRAYNDEPTEAVKALVDEVDRAITRFVMLGNGSTEVSCEVGARDLTEKRNRLHALCPELFEVDNGDA